VGSLKKHLAYGARRKKHAKDPNMGMRKHRTSGHAPGPDHFTGKKAGKKTRRKGKNGFVTRKMRQMRRKTANNKYACFSKASKVRRELKLD